MICVRGFHDGQDKASLPTRVPCQMIELVHAGRSPEELAHEFEPTAQSIRNWVSQSARNGGRGDSGLTTAEREELNRLRRENRSSGWSGRSSQRRRPGSLWRRTRSLRGVPVRERSQASYPIATMCALLGVSSSGCYAWVK